MFELKVVVLTIDLSNSLHSRMNESDATINFKPYFKLTLNGKRKAIGNERVMLSFLTLQGVCFYRNRPIDRFIYKLASRKASRTKPFTDFLVQLSVIEHFPRTMTT